MCEKITFKESLRNSIRDIKKIDIIPAVNLIYYIILQSTHYLVIVSKNG